MPKRPISATLTVVLDGPNEDGSFSMRYVIATPNGCFSSGATDDLGLNETLRMAGERLEESFGSYIRFEQRHSDG